MRGERLRSCMSSAMRRMYGLSRWLYGVMDSSLNWDLHKSDPHGQLSHYCNMVRKKRSRQQKAEKISILQRDREGTAYNPCSASLFRWWPASEDGGCLCSCQQAVAGELTQRHGRMEQRADVVGVEVTMNMGIH